jgi:hypothetical protein
MYLILALIGRRRLRQNFDHHRNHVGAERAHGNYFFLHRTPLSDINALSDPSQDIFDRFVNVIDFNRNGMFGANRGAAAAPLAQGLVPRMRAIPAGVGPCEAFINAYAAPGACVCIDADPQTSQAHE